MAGFLIALFWAVVNYMYASKVKDLYNELDVEPIYYLVGGFLLSFVPLLYCWNKKKNFEKYHSC